jgi:hypothetical protein
VRFGALHQQELLHVGEELGHGAEQLGRGAVDDRLVQLHHQLPSAPVHAHQRHAGVHGSQGVKLSRFGFGLGGVGGLCAWVVVWVVAWLVWLVACLLAWFVGWWDGEGSLARAHKYAHSHASTQARARVCGVCVRAGVCVWVRERESE